MDQFKAQLEQTLQGAIQGTTESIKAATNTLHTEFYKKPETVPALVEILQQNPEPSLRQLAGVEAKKILMRFWSKYDDDDPTPLVPEDQKAHIRQSLLESTARETNDLVRHTSARVVAAIASQDMDSNQYPELLPTVLTFCQSSEAKTRELGVFLIYAILSDDLSDVFVQHSKDIMQLLATSLKDPESLQVRVSSVLALNLLFLSLDEAEQKQFEQLVPTFVEILGQCIEQDDEKCAADLFEAFNELTLPEPCPLNPYYGELIQHMMNSFAKNQNLDDDLRNAALNFVLNVARFRYKKIQNLKLGTEIVKGCIEILAQPTDEDDDEDEDTDTPGGICLRLLSHLSELLPPKQVIAPVIETLPSLVNSGNPHQAFAGFMSYAATVEGAPEYADQHLDAVLPLVVQCLSAEPVIVKVAAFKTLAVLSTELPLSVGEEHATLLPLVFGILDSATSIKIARTACLALVRILEILDRKTITENYLDAVVVKLMSLVGHIDDLELKGIVVECIGGAAVSAGKNFMPYFEKTVAVIQEFIGVPNPETATPGEIKLAGMSLETLSTLCSAVGADAFRPYLAASMAAAFNYLASGVTGLRENALIMISVAAKVYKDEFVPYLDQTMDIVFEICNQLEFPLDQFEDDENIGLDEDNDEGIKVNSDVAVEKEYACDLVREILSNVSASHYNKYLEQTFEVMEELSLHFYYDIRREVVQTIWKLFTTYISSEIPVGKWTPGFPFNYSQLSEVNQTIAAKVIEITAKMFGSEDEAPVLSTMFDCMQNAIRVSGPVVLGTENDFDGLMSNILLVLKQEHPCQVGDDLDDEPVVPGEEEVAEGATALIDFAVDLLSQIVAAFGDAFLPLFPVIAEALQPYVTSKNPSERQTGLSAFAEIYRNIQGNVAEHDATIMQIFVGGLGDKKLGVRSVSAWGAGLMYEFSKSEELLRSSYPTILGKLQNLLKKVDKAEKKRVETDEEELHNDNLSLANACGCVARISLRFPQLVPLDQVLPVLFSRLPLESGYEENPPIFKLFWQLIEGHNATLASNLSELVRVLDAVVSKHIEVEDINKLKGVYEMDLPSPLDDSEAQTAVAQIVRALSQSNPELVTPSLATVIN